MIARIIVVLVVAVALASALLWSQTRHEPLKVSGFIESDEIRVGSRVGGRVAKVHVTEGVEVKSGDALVELEPFDLNERLAQAKAERSARQAEVDRVTAGFRIEEKAQAKAQLDQRAARQAKLEAGPRKQEIATAQAELRQAKADVELAQLQYNRAKDLFDKNTLSRSEYDQAVARWTTSQEAVKVRTEQLNLLLEGTRAEDLQEARAQTAEAEQMWKLRDAGYRVEEIAQSKAAFEAADAATRIFETQLKELKIASPTTAVVESIDLQPGDLVAANAPVVTLADRARLWVRAYLPENHLSIKEGHVVSVTVDSLPGKQFKAHVSFIARQAEFRPGNVQTPEERSKQVFRIKVELDEGLDQLRPGMVADVWFEPHS
jgi:multidrug resistance efflux pump